MNKIGLLILASVIITYEQPEVNPSCVTMNRIQVKAKDTRKIYVWGTVTYCFPRPGQTFQEEWTAPPEEGGEFIREIKPSL